MSKRMNWKADSSGLLTAALPSWWGGRMNIVVEALPGGGWDWVAWSDGEAVRRVLGQAPSLEAAMTAAERAAAKLVSSTIGGGAVHGL